MRIKTIISVLIVCLCLIAYGCKSSDEVINDAVKSLNNNCPLTVMNLGILEKVEYTNNEFVFYINHNVSMDIFTYAEIKQIESSLEARNNFMRKLFSNNQVCSSLRNITLSIAEEKDLTFKVIYNNRDSGNEIKYKLPWREVSLVTPNILKK